MINHNPFSLPKSQYTRRTDFLGDYVKAGAYFLSKMTGDKEEDCLAYVKRNIEADGQFPLRDPRVLMLEANDEGDREKKVTTLGKYLIESIQRDDLIAPTLTTFYQPTVKQSFQPVYVRSNIAKRKVLKKDMHDYKMQGDKVKEDIANKGQNNRKLANNAVSGAYTVANTVLFNPTAHAVLTSTCRITSGYGNANNEKLLAGNRHYWNQAVVINNLVSIATHTDYPLLESVMTKYQLHYPSVADVMQCIRRGAMKYWLDEVQYREVEVFVEKLNPLERAAFVYTGDLYHLRVFNDAFMRTLFDTLLEVREGKELTEGMSLLKKAHGDVFLATIQIYEDEVRGVNIFSPPAEYTPEEWAKTPLIKKLAATYQHQSEVIEAYADFFSVFFTSTNVPASLAYFPDSIRHVALTSDTDSTIFTTQEWMMWYDHGNYHTKKADLGGALANMFAGLTIKHLLALMSANFGVKAPDLEVIDMKNEFKFPVFSPTNVSKHYFTTRSIQEGHVLPQPEKEIKGVHMKASNVPKKVNKAAEDFMLSLLDRIGKGEKINLGHELKLIADEEREIIASIRSGSPEYCRYSKVKELATYRLGAERSPYAYHLFWNEVFGPKYGEVPEPPYLMVKLNTDLLGSPSAMQQWASSLKDQELAQRFLTHVKRTGKKRYGTLYIPLSIVENRGIPDEILELADYRGLIRNVLKTKYIVLEALGYYTQDKKNNRLVSDYY